MKKMFLVFLMVLFMACGLGINNVFALSFSGMNNITVNDGIANSTYNSDGNGISQGKEDNETERSSTSTSWGYNTDTLQKYDYEGMFFDGYSIYVVGGFDFTTDIEKDSFGYPERVGDLFIGDNQGDYDYAIDSLTSNYSTYGDAGTYYENVTATTEPWFIKDAGPFEVSESKNKIDGMFTISYGTATDTGFDSWYTQNGGYHNPDDLIGHNFIQYELNSGYNWSDIIGDGKYIHLTMACGNDSIDGQIAPVPEPTTILLSGLGILGIGVFFRKKMFVKGMM